MLQFVSPKLECRFEDMLSGCDLPIISDSLPAASNFGKGRDVKLSTLPLGEMLVGDVDVDPSALEELDIRIKKE